MDLNRIEKTPIFLKGLAAAALGMSCLAAMYADFASKSQTNKSHQLANSNPTANPIYWSGPRLAPIDLSTLSDASQSHASYLAESDLLKIKTPSLEELEADDPLWLLTAEDLISVTKHTSVTEQGNKQLVIYLPAAPKRTAARPVVLKRFAITEQIIEPKITSLSLKIAASDSDWKVFGWDSLGTVKAFGKWWGATQAPSLVPKSEIDRASSPKAVEVNLSAAPRLINPRPPINSLRLVEPKKFASKPIAKIRAIEFQPNKTQVIVEPKLVAPEPTIVAKELTISNYLLDGGSAGLFPVPVALGEQLDRLAEHPDTAGWAWSFAYRLRGLVGSSTNNVVDAERILEVLSDESTEAYELADTLLNKQVAAELRRSHYAINRRIDAWHACLTLRTELIARQQSTPIRGIELLEVQQLEKIRWAMASNPLRKHPMIAVRLPRQQQPMRLAAKLESFEDKPISFAARDIARKVAILAENSKVKKDVTSLAIVEAVEENYRNANLRVAISKELLQRLFKEPKATTSSVNDRIAGRPVRGSSTTRTTLDIETIPDDSSWRLGLKANGVIESDTISFGGPARLRSMSKTNFVAAKEIKVGFDGIKALPTEVKAKRERNKLVGVSTKYDKVPLFGSYARSTAKKEYSKARTRVKAEVELKAENRIQSTMDTKAEPKLAKIEDRYREAILDRARQLGMEVDPIELRTTDSRLIGRIRLANKQQLAAHTPRMRAPSDSVLSFQLHESTVNNAIEGLGLEGNRFTTAALREHIADRFAIEMDELGTSPQRASLTFNELEPARVTFEEGKVRLTLSLNEMSIRGAKQANFKVHTLYEPELIGDEAWLVQKGTAQIEGNMRTSSRVRLHAALGKVLGEERKIPLIRMPSDAKPELRERLSGLTTNQLVIEDGWLGVAVGPARSTDIAVRIGTYVR